MGKEPKDTAANVEEKAGGSTKRRNESQGVSAGAESLGENDRI